MIEGRVPRKCKRYIEKLLHRLDARYRIGESASEADALLQELSVKRFVIIAGAKVTYALPPKGAEPDARQRARAPASVAG